MSPSKSLWALALLLASSADSIAADKRPPTYRVLQRSTAMREEPQVRTGYAYGWFGAAPRKHPQRHFGYYRHYTQWSWK